MKKRFTEEQIVYDLKQSESGVRVTDLIRTMGISEQTFYRWKKQFAGLGVSELRELKQLREENTKLKSLVADLSLDKHILQEIISKKL
jgi:putative transposase